MSKETKFSSLATAATQADLAHPKFAVCAKSWTEVARAVTVVVPASVAPPEIKGVKFVKAAGEDLLLSDVLRYGSQCRGGDAPDYIVVDPLVQLSRGIIDVMGIAQKRHLGKAWMATAQAIATEDEKEPGKFEFNALRFFVGPAGIWNHVRNALVKTPNVPFKSPIWGGFVAGYQQFGEVRTDKARYHDVTDLNSVACYYKDVPVLNTDGYGTLVFNVPSRNYVKPPVS
jgi:hypothetical protein